MFGGLNRFLALSILALIALPPATAAPPTLRAALIAAALVMARLEWPVTTMRAARTHRGQPSAEASRRGRSAAADRRRNRRHREHHVQGEDGHTNRLDRSREEFGRSHRGHVLEERVEHLGASFGRAMTSRTFASSTDE